MDREPDKTGRKQDGKFAPGHSGNPSGRPTGSRHRVSRAVEKLLDGEAEALTRKAIELAKGGDITALRLCLDRIAPPRKDAPISIDLPPIETPADTVKAAAAVLDAVASGQVTPSEGSAVGALVETFRRAIESEDLERRVKVLESKK